MPYITNNKRDYKKEYQAFVLKSFPHTFVYFIKIYPSVLILFERNLLFSYQIVSL